MFRRGLTPSYSPLRFQAPIMTIESDSKEKQSASAGAVPLLVDTHCHVYLPRFDADRDEVVRRAREAGVRIVVQSAIDVESVHHALDLCDRYEGFHAMAAIHPSETKDASDEDMEAIAALCADDRIVAVGESGLDHYWDRTFDARQEAFFRRHIELAIEADLPLVIHNRDASDDVVRVLREGHAASGHSPRLRGIFHCFGGPFALYEQASDLGFLVGIGGTVTFKNGGVDEVVRRIPLSGMVLETDAPFLAPVPYRGKRNEPAYVALVAARIAEVKHLPLDEVASRTTENALALFRISA